MKILKIHFKNINSLKGEHHIDFTAAPFTSNSLFAITGPTGSGKSTLLDVISLALFNQVPRLGKISKKEIINKGALLTRNQKEAEARITYKCKTGIYVSEWSISTARTGNLRDYEMQIFDLSTGKALDLKKSDVPAKNEELIGLNYDQFIKSVLLAQGEFAQFLKARKEERGELLEKITGTGIYRQLGIKAFQKFKEVNAAVEDEMREMQLLKNSLLDEEDLHLLKTSLNEEEQQVALFEKNMEELEKKLNLKRNIQEQKTQIEQQTNLQNTAKSELAKFHIEHGKKLKQHETVQLFAEGLRNWKALVDAKKELDSQLSINSQKQEDNERQIGNCFQDIKTFIKADAAVEHVEEKLQQFSQTVRKLQNSREEKLNTYQNLQDRFHLEVREVPFQLNGNLATSEDKLLELLHSGQEVVTRIKNQFPKLNFENTAQEKQRLKKELEQARKAGQLSEKLDNLSAEILKSHNEIKTLAADVKELPGKIALEEANAATLSQKLEKLRVQKENQVLQANLEELRQQLVAGESCPLCGSTEHPFAEGLPKPVDGLQEEIDQTAAALSRLSSSITTRKTTLEHLSRNMKNLEATAFEKQEQLNSQKKAFEKEFEGMLPKELKHWSQFVELLDRQIAELEKFDLENRKLKAIKAGLPLLEQLKEVLTHGKELKKELESLYTGNNIDKDCLDLQNSWTGFQHTQRSLKQLAIDIKEKQMRTKDSLKELERQLLPEVEKTGCKSLEQALQQLLPERDYAQLRTSRDRLINENEKLEAVLKTLKIQLERLKENDVERSEDLLRQEFEAMKIKLKELRDSCEEVRRKIKNHQDLEQRIAKLDEGLAVKKKTTRRWELLNQLIGDATGKKFNDFAQDLSLSHLLQHANVRLQDLSDRYRIDKPSGDEDDGLVAIDEHMGGQRRSVKTLSGGETFILSLSMALALSDLASQNVEINSLFIDEGFGTLDPDTLDHTLDTLEKLQAESSKTIGIISHVDSLKERIATQICLQRNGQGYSSLIIKD